MASAAKIVKMPGPGLSPELRELLDQVVVPALLKKYLAERDGDKAIAAPISIAPASEAAAYSREKRHKGSE